MKTHSRTLPALAIAVVLSAGLQYLWIFRDLEGSFYVWGFPIVPAVLVASLPLLMVHLRQSGPEFLRALITPGPFRFWILGTVLPAVAFGLVLLYGMGTAGRFAGSERFNAIAISTGFDLPMIYLWTLPLLLAMESTWRWPLQEPGGGAAAMMRSSFFWTLANVMLAADLQAEHGWAVSLSFVLLLFAMGMYLFALQRKGSMLVSAWSLLLIAVGVLLCFDNRIPLVNRILFGSNHSAMDGILLINRVPYTVPLLILAGMFILFANLLARLPASRKG